GVCYVVDVFNKRLHPKEFIEVIIDRVRTYQYTLIAIEAQMAQEFFADTLGDRLQDLGYPAHTRLVPVKQRTRKELRIEAMSPDVHNGRIRYKKSQTELIGQYEKYPMVAYDDMVDATEMAYNIATDKNTGTIEVAGDYYARGKGGKELSQQERLANYTKRYRRRRYG